MPIKDDKDFKRIALGASNDSKLLQSSLLKLCEVQGFSDLSETSTFVIGDSNNPESKQTLQS